MREAAGRGDGFRLNPQAVCIVLLVREPLSAMTSYWNYYTLKETGLEDRLVGQEGRWVKMRVDEDKWLRG